jgi:hypothetical protein
LASFGPDEAKTATFRIWSMHLLLVTRVLSRHAAAAKLSCSARTLDRLRRAGEIDEISVSQGRVGICAGSLEEYIERQRNRKRRQQAEPTQTSSAFAATHLPIPALDNAKRRRTKSNA